MLEEERHREQVLALHVFSTGRFPRWESRFGSSAAATAVVEPPALPDDAIDPATNQQPTETDKP
jgi:hypothetical protein